MSFRLLSLSFAISIILPFSFLRATTFLMTTDEEKMREATAICDVKVVSIRAESVGSAIRTRATVKPIECFKGNEQAPFDVIYPGGKMGNRSSLVPGTPDLQKDQRAILYLWKKQPSDRDYMIHSLGLGVIPLELDRTRNEYRLSRPLTRGAYRTATSGNRSARASRSTVIKEDEKINLSDFRAKVQNALRSQP